MTQTVKIGKLDDDALVQATATKVRVVYERKGRATVHLRHTLTLIDGRTGKLIPLANGNEPVREHVNYYQLDLASLRDGAVITIEHPLTVLISSPTIESARIKADT